MGELDDRFLDLARKLDAQEPAGGIKVVLTFFVDDPDHVVFRGCWVLKNLVDLTKLERLLVVIVSDADSEMSVGFCHRDRTLRFSFPQHRQEGLCHIGPDLYALTLLAVAD